MNDLLADYSGIRARSVHDDLSDLPDAELAAFRTRLRAAVARLALDSSPYAAEAERAASKSAGWSIVTYAGILRALRDDIAAGWMTTVEELLHADTFSDFIEMSKELLDKSYKDAAAVVTGTVLEVHLRLLAVKNGVADVEKKKADRVNADLVKANVYSQLQQKQVTAWLAIRNSAAHGDYGDYDHQDVARLNRDVPDFVLKFPA